MQKEEAVSIETFVIIAGKSGRRKVLISNLWLLTALPSSRQIYAFLYSLIFFGLEAIMYSIQSIE